MIFNCINRYLFDHLTGTGKDKNMKSDIELNTIQHEEWLAFAKAEAKKRFLRLEPVDPGHCDWRLYNSSGEIVFPQGMFGASKRMINGFFAQNPQA